MPAPIRTPLRPNEVALLQREADRAAARLVRAFRLPAHERDDLRQDLLVDLISRIKDYDPARGCLGAFTATVVAHRTARLARRICRDRAVFAPVSLDDPAGGAEAITLGETIAEDGGYAALMGQPANDVAALERRLDLGRGLEQLRQPEQALCAELIHHAPS